MREAKPSYVFTLDNSDLQKQVVSLHYHSRLDEPATLRVRLAFPPQTAAKMDTAQLCEKATLRVLNRGVFQGSLVDTHVEGPGRLELIFIDGTFKMSKVSESDFFKGLSLEDFLKRMAEISGLTARFKGSFGTSLPAFNVLGHSLLSHVQQLGSDYGFHFFARSFASEIHFCRLDQPIDTQELDLRKSASRVTSVRATHSSRHAFGSAEIRCFDSANQKSEKRELSSDSLYAPLGYLRQAKSFSKRMQRAHSAGREERLCTQSKQFAEAPEHLANELSKRALDQNQLIVQLGSLPALLGDRLNIQGSMDTDSEGAYLVQGLNIEIAGAYPQVQLQLRRG